MERLVTTVPPSSNARLVFLMKIFYYFDVMIALSLHRIPLDLPYNPELSHGPIDEIFGLTAGLWPTMHLVAQILASKDRPVADAEMLARARGLVDQLAEPYAVEVAEQEATQGHSVVDLEALVQISNAYRASVLLVLHHEVLQTHDPDPLAKVYRQALDALLRIAALDGPMATYSTSVSCRKYKLRL